MESQNRATGPSRRQMLTRGLTVGSAVWAAPTVTAIALTPANAASPSDAPPKPTQPPKPPDLPTDEPTSPSEHTPKPKPPSDETPSRTPSGNPTSPAGHDDKPSAGSELPDTGPGDLARNIAVGGALAAGGAVLYATTRKSGEESHEAPPT